MRNTKSELQSIQEWYRYNSFVRKKYLEVIFSQKVSEKERYKNRGASYPSLVDIFVHVLDAYRWWFLYVYNDDISKSKDLREQKKYSKKEVAREERKIDSRVMDFVYSLRPKDLDRVLTVHKGPTQSWTIKVSVMLLHMIEEELQHRGELNALLWQLNVDPPVLEYQDYVNLRN